MRIFLAALLSLFIAAPAWAAPVCAAREEAAPALSRLQDAMAEGRFVAYQPTELKVWEGNPVQASEVSIREDLEALRPWFDSLVTYGSHSGAELIPGIAKELGYRAVVMGVWNPADDREVGNAVAAWEAHPDIVAGVSLGNEMILSGRGTWADLEKAIGKFHDRAPGLPLTVTEPFAIYLDDAQAVPVLAKLDFLAVNVHPVFEKWFAGAPPFNWADFVKQVSSRLAAESFCGPILIKETGVPTAPAEEGFTPEAQKAFFGELAKQMPPARDRAFAYFSAFDAPWRVYDESAVAGHHPEEAHWGLFTEEREPKPVMETVPKLD
jgi:exo-beta-1,3-glucanase (GH17 family)